MSVLKAYCISHISVEVRTSHTYTCKEVTPWDISDFNISYMVTFSKMLFRKQCSNKNKLQENVTDKYNIFRKVFDWGLKVVKVGFHFV